MKYVEDIQRTMANGVMATTVLLIDKTVVMVGHRGGAKIQQPLRAAGTA